MEPNSTLEEVSHLDFWSKTRTFGMSWASLKAIHLDRLLRLDRSQPPKFAAVVDVADPPKPAFDERAPFPSISSRRNIHTPNRHRPELMPQYGI